MHTSFIILIYIGRHYYGKEKVNLSTTEQWLLLAVVLAFVSWVVWYLKFKKNH